MECTSFHQIDWACEVLLYVGTRNIHFSRFILYYDEFHCLQLNFEIYRLKPCNMNIQVNTLDNKKMFLFKSRNSYVEN